ncbi:hypothetical protein PR001_g30058 [Phytophthora rubi]|uniref:Uncharacterized protein n=1 Tax=Phytophthora rubi TaxID=129364 RepID=A0A6A3GWV1_9STRA|nr:hypothetical protein PR001_g30058 [Phytophthora rubi]
MRQAVRDRYHIDKQAPSDETDDTDDEVTDEDSEGNKYVGRIIKPNERPFLSESMLSVTTSDPISTGEGSPIHSTVAPRGPLPALADLIDGAFTSCCPSPTPTRPTPTPDLAHTNRFSTTPSGSFVFSLNEELSGSLSLTRSLDLSGGESQNNSTPTGAINLNAVPNNALANGDILSYWRWLFAEVADDHDDGVNEDQADDYTMHEYRGLDEHDSLNQPDI